MRAAVLLIVIGFLNGAVLCKESSSEALDASDIKLDLSLNQNISKNDSEPMDDIVYHYAPHEQQDSIVTVQIPDILSNITDAVTPSTNESILEDAVSPSKSSYESVEDE